MIDLASRAIVGEFYDTLEQEFASSWAQDIAWLNPDSMNPTETYKWLGATPALREWIGGRAAKGLRTESYALANKLFEGTVEFDVDDLKRDDTGQVSIRIGELAQRAVYHWEKLITDLIIADGLCYDGQNFFDTDHSSGASGSQKNELTSSEIADLNISSATAPTPDEAAKLIQALIGWFFTLKDDQAELINGGARAFQIQVATVPLWSAFSTALSATSLASGASNPVQGLLSKGFKVNLVLNANLTSSTDLVRIFRTDARVKPFILQQMGPAEIQVLDDKSEYAKLNNKAMFGVKAVRNAGYGLWQYGLKATLV